MDQVLAVILVVLIACPPACPPAFSQPIDENIKDKIVRIPTSSFVEVRLVNNAKLRGRMGAVSGTGFDLQIGHRNKVRTQQISFDPVTAFRDTKPKSLGDSLDKAFLISGIALIPLVVTLGILCGTHHCGGE